MLMADKEIVPTVVGTLKITITGACGLKRWACFPPKCYVVVSIGDQTYKMKVTSRGGNALWNETITFKCAAQGIQDCDIVINLYCKGFFGRGYLLGRIKDRLLDVPRNKEVTKVFSHAHKNNPIEITFRVGETMRIPKFFALIIGVEKYKSPKIEDLDGCVNDAQVMKSFLCERLLVPDSHIVLLSNETATREAILSNFQTHLIENPNIDQGDAIVFFYAGHGSRVEAPAGWISTDNKIETICPHDEWIEDGQGNAICGIPDRTISSLLRKLASVKGDNITVIFDSCHSGGIARSSLQGSSLRARFIKNPCPIPETTDSAIWMSGLGRSAKVIIPEGFSHEAMSSHVLLAACRQDQVAYESISSDGIHRGAFTSSLFRKLSQIALDRVSYSELVELLPDLIHQNPQCEGKNKNRILFDAQNVSRDASTFRVTEKFLGTFEVDAGRIHGVVPGTTFTIQLAGTVFGVLVAEKVMPDSSILVLRAGDTRFSIPQSARALILDWNTDPSTLKVFIHPGSEQQVENALCLKPSVSLSQPDPPPQIQKRNFVLVNSRTLADVDIKLDSNKALDIERLDPLLTKHASPIVRVTQNMPHRLPFILDAAAHFKYHLARHHVNDQLSNITMELYRLTTDGFRVPDTTVGNLLVGNEARLRLDKNAEYGIAIFNNSKHDLFPYLFYFDPSDYSIQSWYLPPARAMDPPLPQPLGTDPVRVTVGYGAGGGDPFEFTLKPGERSDTGFVKLFVSTKYVDMDWITQESPFGGSSKRGLGDQTTDQDTGVWGAWTVAVTVFADV